MIITIIGNTIEKPKFEDYARKLMFKGHTIFLPNYYPGYAGVTVLKEQKKEINRDINNKIHLSDAILILDSTGLTYDEFKPLYNNINHKIQYLSEKKDLKELLK